MSNGQNNLRFQVYTTSSTTVPVGDYTDGSYGGGYTWNIFSPGGGSWTRSVNFTSKILAGQEEAPSGLYLQSIPINITYLQTGSTPCPTAGLGGATIQRQFQATVAPTCTISATGVNFGTVQSLAVNTDASGTISVSCTSGQAYSLSLNGGLAGATDPTQRRMVNGADEIIYGLYRDAARTQPWGADEGINTVSGSGTGVVQVLSVYGRAPPQTTPAPATYQDTVVVTLTY